jgi:hypothetical protein
MAKTYGSIALPQVKIDTSKYLTIFEYVLTSTELSGSAKLIISDIPVGAAILKVEIDVTTPFVGADGSSPSVQINGGETILMGSDWNNPEEVGLYTTDCRYVVTGSMNELSINYTPENFISGALILRISTYGSL